MERHTTSSPIPFRNHTALLLSVTLPYLQPTYRYLVELALKFLEFTETLNLYHEFRITNSSQHTKNDQKESGLFGLINTFILDIEGLLNSLSSVCTGDEKEIISMFLNIIHIKNFYETYNDLTKMPMMFSSESNSSPIDTNAKKATDTTIDCVISEDLDNLSNENFSEQTNTSIPNIPFFPSDLTSMLNEEQKETLDLLKSLFASE